MSITKAFFNTLYLVLLWVACNIVVFLLYKVTFGNVEDLTHLFGLSKTVCVVVAYGIFIFSVRKPNFRFKKVIHETSFKAKDVLLICTIVFGLFLFNRILIDFSKIVDFYHNSTVVSSVTFRTNNTALIYTIISTLFISPITEELFFRKFLIDGLIKKQNIITTLIVSSTCFSLIHIETPNNLIPAFLGGLVMGYIYIKTNKIGYSLLFHFLYNTIIFISNHYGFSSENIIFGFTFNALYWLISLAGLVVVWFGIKKL